MKSVFHWLMTISVMVLVGSYIWSHRSVVAIPPAVRVSQTQTEEVQPRNTEQDQAQQFVTITGPLADYVMHQNARPGNAEQTVSPVAVASDHVESSPVGTSTALLHKTFPVTRAVDLPFDVPPHAATAQLRGTYRSFHSAVSEASDETGDEVEFLLLNRTAAFGPGEWTSSRLAVFGGWITRAGNQFQSSSYFRSAGQVLPRLSKRLAANREEVCASRLPDRFLRALGLLN